MPRSPASPAAEQDKSQTSNYTSTITFVQCVDPMHGLTEIPKRFQYSIFFRNSEQHFNYTVELDPETLEHTAPEGNPPLWAELGYKQCPHCPLTPAQTPYCPLAVRVAPLVKVPKCKSYDPVQASVVIDEKRISTDTTAQEAFSSLLGLVMATSGCPHTNFFKPLAWYHQPFAPADETLFRVCASYLTSEYLLNNRKPADLSQLKIVYDNMHTINVKIANRITYDVQTDSTLNAIVLLDLLTKDLPMAIDEGLNELTTLFVKASGKLPR